MLLQETGIPDNLAYLVLGIAVLLTIIGGWLVSYFLRLRNLQRDMVMFTQLAEDDGVPARVVEPIEADPDNANAPSAQPT